MCVGYNPGYVERAQSRVTQLVQRGKLASTQIVEREDQIKALQETIAYHRSEIARAEAVELEVGRVLPDAERTLEALKKLDKLAKRNPYTSTHGEYRETVDAIYEMHEVGRAAKLV